MLTRIIVTFFGSGLLKPSGTFGSAASLLAIWPFLQYITPKTAIIIVLCTFAIGYIAIRSYTKDMIEKDPHEIVIDETLGMYIALFGGIFTLPNIDIKVITILSFAIFRFFDIVKPLGISFIDTKIKGPLGTMLDDAIAGLYSAILLYIIFNIF